MVVERGIRAGMEESTFTATAVRLRPGERILEPTWSAQIVILSFLVSWLGAFTSSQVLAQADVTRRGSRRLAWLALASATFGWQTIWSLHFVRPLHPTPGGRTS